MKLLLDENLSPRLIPALVDLYPDSDHIENRGLLSGTDDDIWQYALRNGFVIATKDSDFSERSVLEGCPPKIVWLRLGNCPVRRARAALRDHVAQIRAFGTSQTDCCLVISVAPSKPPGQG